MDARLRAERERVARIIAPDAFADLEATAAHHRKVGTSAELRWAATFSPSNLSVTEVRRAYDAADTILAVEEGSHARLVRDLRGRSGEELRTEARRAENDLGKRIDVAYVRDPLFRQALDRLWAAEQELERRKKR